MPSSLIKAIAYEPGHAILEVEFVSQAIYHYYGVPEEVFQEFLRASSPGQFFDLYIKQVGYEYARIE
ncbi:MAG: hypothetical protein OHK0053_29510 [Microscillaceae bacterium]